MPRRGRDAAARWQLGRCLSACPSGRYGGADGVCRTCDAACRECDGPTNKHCTAPGGLPGARKRRAAADAHCAEGATLMGFGCELPGRCAEGRYLVKPEAPPVSTFAIFGGKGGAAAPAPQCVDCEDNACKRCAVTGAGRGVTCLACRPFGRYPRCAAARA